MKRRVLRGGLLVILLLAAWSELQRSYPYLRRSLEGTARSPAFRRIPGYYQALLHLGIPAQPPDEILAEETLKSIRPRRELDPLRVEISPTAKALSSFAETVLPMVAEDTSGAPVSADDDDAIRIDSSYLNSLWRLNDRTASRTNWPTVGFTVKDQGDDSYRLNSMLFGLPGDRLSFELKARNDQDDPDNRATVQWRTEW